MTLRRAFVAVLFTALGASACGSTPKAVTVRFADDVPSDEIESRCKLATLEAQGACLDGPQARITNAAAPFVGKTLRCSYASDTGLGACRAPDFAATVIYPGGLDEHTFELRYDRSIDGSDRAFFSGRWAEREAWPDHVRYRHDVGTATLGGYCESSDVHGLVETLSVYEKALVLREEWRCGLKGHSSELRCELR